MSESDVDISVAETGTGRSLVIPLDACAVPASRIGGKASGLAELVRHGMSVPAAFVITADAYREVVAGAGLDIGIAEICARQDLDVGAKSALVRELFADLELPVELSEEIDSAYAGLGGGGVAVRSSGTAEDTAAASFAGQHDTYLWVEGATSVRDRVVRCWASLFNSNAIEYRDHFHTPADEVAMAVVVQRMVPATAAGVMMTIEPVTGERDKIFIEAAHGLGEGVVSGNVVADRFWVDKTTLGPVRSSVNTQTAQYVFDRRTGRVVVEKMDPELGGRPSIDAELVRRVAELGRDIESAFGRAMDVEWAVSGDREVFLLQARPETVWSNRSRTEEPVDAAQDREAAGVDRPTIHEELNPGWYYSTANLGEAAPGVLAPLTWSVWGPGAEIAARYGFVKMGVLEKSKAGVPDDPHERFITIAFGRAVASVSAFYEMGERIPGASGDVIAESLLGEIPDGMTPNPTKRRYPHVMWNMPRAFLRAKRVLVRQYEQIGTWWSEALDRTPGLDLAGAKAQFLDACGRFREATALQAQSNIIALPPIYEQLQKLAASAGMADAFGRLTAGGGDHAETEVLADLWDVSRDRLTEREFLARHGYHGAMEGDIAGAVWREDPEQVRRLVALYRDQPEEKDPRRIAELRVRDRQAAEAELLSRIGAAQRPTARLILKLAHRNIPMRGVGKVSFLRSLDIARASARRIGTILVADGVLDEVDDVMYLTADELTGTIPADARRLVTQRKAEQALYRGYELPVAFWGEPVPRRRGGSPAGTGPAEGTVTGIGVSAGVVEGVARVVTDPTFAEVEPDEILVAATTDPSWASIMLVSAGLVVDIGGLLSHAAVVARELGLPCVVNTGNGTSVLRTGDRVRVDGAAGTVDILERMNRDQAKDRT